MNKLVVTKWGPDLDRVCKGYRMGKSAVWEIQERREIEMFPL